MNMRLHLYVCLYVRSVLHAFIHVAQCDATYCNLIQINQIKSNILVSVNFCAPNWGASFSSFSAALPSQNLTKSDPSGPQQDCHSLPQWLGSCTPGPTHDLKILAQTAKPKKRTLAITFFEWSHPDTVHRSDLPSESVYGTYICVYTMYVYIYIIIFILYTYIFWRSILTFCLAHALTFYLASILTYFLASILTFFLAFYLASILIFFLAFYLASFHSGILAFSSGILSVPVQARPTASGAPDMRFGSRPSPNMRFGPRRSPELAIWGSATSWHTSGQERNRGEEEEGEGGVAPLLKSRDPHLAGGEESTEVFRNKLVYISTGGRPPFVTAVSQAGTSHRPWSTVASSCSWTNHQRRPLLAHPSRAAAHMFWKSGSKRQWSSKQLSTS